MYKLVIQDDEGKTTIVPLVRDAITVGRKEGNTIRLTERNVSRQHARIVRANGSVAVEDLDSYNGVRVNGNRIQGHQELTLKDRVQIGDYLIELKADDDDAPIDKEHHTEPLEGSEDGAGSSSSIPVAQDTTDPEAKTRPMQAQVVPADSSAIAAAPDGGAKAAAAEPVPAAAPAAQAAAPAQPQPEPARAARLIVLSANFAGAEFPLTDPAMVIGRTEENDIVINHRSISRNHAKIVRESGHYAVVDLQSSNGVRVNGEEYGKVELRRGDIIDLGHVRLRFADPDDDYIFTSADIQDVTASGGKGIWYALLAVVVLIGGIGVFALMDSGSEAASGTPQPPRTPPTTSPGVVPTTPDATEAPDIAEDDPAALLEQIKQAIAERKWAHAQVAADKLLEREPGNAEAKELSETAKREALNEGRYQEMTQAIESERYAAVPKKLAELDEESVYFAQAQEAHDQALDDYVRNQVMPEAEKLAGARKCTQLQSLENKVRRQWAEAAGQVSPLVTECRAALRASRTEPRRQNNTQRQGGNTTKPSGGNEQSGKSFDALMTEAKDAAKAGQYGRAQRLCSDALKLKPGNQEAVSVCGIAACGQNNAKAAKRYHKMAIGERKQQIVQICLIKGIDILR